jgi:hypothetical protein
VYYSVANHFTMDVVRMTAAIRKLLITLITIEGEGDSTAAANLRKTYSNIRPDLNPNVSLREQWREILLVPFSKSPPGVNRTVQPSLAFGARQAVPRFKARISLI